MTDVSELSKWLQSTQLFRGLALSQLLLISQIAQSKQFPKGELIFRQDSEKPQAFLSLKQDE
jgi:CRP-like cAMP-binding protein